MFRRFAGSRRCADAERRVFTTRAAVALAPVFRRLILPALCAIGLICAVELVIQLRYHPGFWQKTTWLMHDPYKGELFDRSELYLRLSHLEDSDPDIIS